MLNSLQYIRSNVRWVLLSLSVFSCILLFSTVASASQGCQLEDLSTQIELEESQAECFLAALESLKLEGKREEAFSYLKLLEERISTDQMLLRRRIISSRNECYLLEQDIVSANAALQQELRDLLALFETSKDPKLNALIGLCHLRLAYCLDHLGDNVATAAALDKAEKYLGASDDHGAMCRVYRLRATLANDDQNFERALYYDRLSYGEAIAADQVLLKIVSLNNMASRFKDLGEIDSSKYYCRKAIAMYESNPLKDKRVSMYVGLAGILVSEGAYDEAKELLKTPLADLDEEKDAHFYDRKLLFEQVAKIYSAEGEANLAYEWMAKAYEEAKLAQRELLEARLGELEFKNNRANEDTERRLLEEKLEKQEQMTIFSWILFAGVLLLGAAIFLSARQIRKKNRLLVDFSDNLKQKGLQLAEANEQVVEINESLEDKVNARTAELIVANQQLLELERNARLANFTIDSVDIAIFWLDKQGRHIKLNPSVEQLFGYTEEEFRKIRMEDLDPSKDPFTFEQFWEETKSRKNWVLQRNAKRKDETIIPTNIYGHYLQFDGQEYVCAFVVNTQEEVQRQAQLKAQNKSSRMIANLANQLINSNSQELGAIVKICLRELAQLYGADRAYFVELVQEQKYYSLTHSWARKPAFAHDNNRYQAVDAEISGLSVFHENKEALFVKSVDELPKWAYREKKAMEKDGLKTVCMVPSFVGGQKFGFLGMDGIDEDKPDWGEEQINTLGILGEIISSTFVRTRKEESLSIFQKRMELSLEAASVAIWEVNFNEDIRFYSKDFFRILEFPRAEFENLSFADWMDRLHPEDVENFKAQWFATLKDSRINQVAIDFRINNQADGKWINLEGRVIERDTEGKVIKARGVIKDISAARTNENKLNSLNRQMAALISSLPGIIYRCRNDEYYTMEFLSKSFARITGYKNTDFILNKRKKWLEIIHPDDREWATEPLLKQIRNEGLYRYSYRIIHADGSIVYCYEQGVPVKDSKGKIVGFEGYITDVTTKVKAEEKIMGVLLEAEDKERQRIAKELHDSLGQTLTAVNFNFDHLRKKLDYKNEEAEELYEKAMSLLNQAIREAREISHGIMPKDIEDFGYVLATQSMISSFKTISPTQLKFMDNLDDERLPKNMELNLFRITQEAITNAIKYAYAEQITIQLMRHSEEVILTIEDNGKGFNLASLANKSTSLGIRNMKNRAAAFSGELIFDSSLGRGTSITVTIPLRNESLPT